MARDSSYFRAKRAPRNAEAFNLVQKILADGCPKKSAAVKEAAAKLGRGERSVWLSLKQHERELEDQAKELDEEEKANRRWEIEYGLVEPTEEEAKEMSDEAEQLYYEHMRLQFRKVK